MRKIVIILSLMALLLPVHICTAQTLTPKEWESIRQNSNYLIGMGMSTSIGEARLAALSDLSGKISVKVRSQYDYCLNNESKGTKVSSEARMKGIIQSYSSVTLNNVSEYVVKDKQNYVVYRYMKQSDLRAMFKRRIDLAKKWAQEAAEREKEYKAGDALQDYYWSLALLRSCPDGDLETLDNSSTNMFQEVFHRVKDILGNITIKAVSVEKEGPRQRVVLDIQYKGKPAVNFNYTYQNGKEKSEVFTAKDGIGELLLPRNASLGNLKINAEYECRDEANIHPDLRNVMESTEPVPFSAAEFKISAKGCPEVKHDEYIMQVATSSPRKTPEPLPTSSVMVDTSSAHDATADAPYISTMEMIEKAMANRNYSSLSGCFTEAGWEMFEKLISYGQAKLLRSPNVSFYREKGLVVCRSFPMSFTFKGNKRVFTEDVVFYMNNDAKVCEVAFALEQAAVSDIMNRLWSEDDRHTVVHFLETYKTAYALKRLDYISSIFSSEALIITGRVVKGTGQTEISPSKPAHIKYVRQTKEQYIKNLRQCFASNEYVNIRFADNIVRRPSDHPNLCGIQIKQDYFSSTYGDTGYLFLLIDFAKPDEPVIHVRTWQPDLDPNVKDGRIGISDFNL